MPNTGNLFPATAEELARGSAAGVWSTPTNAISDNGVDTICIAAGGGPSAGSRYLVCRNFLVALAAGDTVSGITFRVEASEHSSGNETLNAQLQNDLGGLVGTPKALTLSGTGKAIYTYGGIADLWGATLTSLIVNHANFGVRLWFTTAHEVRIDFATVAVEYVLAAVPGGPFPGPIFPGDVFPGPIFPGGEPGADSTVAISSVLATVVLGTLVASSVPDTVIPITGVQVGTSGVPSAPVFPSDIFPGDVFPGPIFPSGITGGDTGGVGFVLPSVTIPLIGIVVPAEIGSVGAQGDVISISGVEASVIVGTLVAEENKALTSVSATGTVGTVVRADGVSELTGVVATASLGTLVVNRDRSFSGVSATVILGQAAVLRIEALSGVSSQVQIGLIAAEPDRADALSGVQAVFAVGSVATDLVGNAAAVAVGTAVPVLDLALTSVVAPVSRGTLVATNLIAVTGVESTVAIQSLVSPTSRTVTLTSVVGTLVAGIIEVPTQLAAITGEVATLSVNTGGPETEVALLGVQVLTAVDTVTTTADREQALTGVESQAVVGFVTAQTDVLAILTGVTSTAQVGIAAVDRIDALSGIESTVAVGTIAPIADRAQALTGNVVTVSLGIIQRESIPLTGVTATAQEGSVDNELFIKLDSLTVPCGVGHTPKEGDVILDLDGLSVTVGSVGILGVGPQLPSSPYRHIAPAPIQKRRLKDLKELEREMALMED